MPNDFETESYYITLWENGKMIDKGDKINSKELSIYTFEGLTTKSKTVDLTVKISGDGVTEYNLFDVTVDNEYGRVKFVKEYKDYPHSSGPETESQPTQAPVSSNSSLSEDSSIVTSSQTGIQPSTETGNSATVGGAE